ncbi:MAG TPA: hypothetical protein VHC20_05540 [Candidatus Paceibacterota bacterium]|nr:hypothetical protein [Candidatus Paceibacterota bacterium]
MKAYLLIPLIFLTACASPQKPRVSVMNMMPARPQPTPSIESVRFPENLKAYPIGRYVDPNNGLVMHERHTVYRIETTAQWNLNPNVPVTVPLGPAVGLIDPARHDAPVNTEVIAEVNRQKAATQALLDQGAKFDQTLSQLSGALQVTARLSEQNRQLRDELTTTQKRLDALEEELRKKQADALAGTNDKTKTDEW